MNWNSDDVYMQMIPPKVICRCINLIYNTRSKCIGCQCSFPYETEYFIPTHECMRKDEIV